MGFRYGTGTNPEPGRPLATMSASWVLIDIVTAGVCNGMYLMTHVGRSSVNAPCSMPTSLLFTVTGAPEVMELLGGRCRVRLAGEAAWQEYAGGSSFSVPGNSSFDIEVSEAVDYVCHFG